MDIQENDNLAMIRRALGGGAPPKFITQAPFDYDSSHLHRLAGLALTAKADCVDLTDYMLDIQYREVQMDLFRYVFPFCLRAWREDLRGIDDKYRIFVEHFYPALVGGRTFERVVKQDEAEVIAAFLRDTILAEIDDQRGMEFAAMGARPYRWIGALMTYGVYRGDIKLLWDAWWSLSTVGRAVAAVQYISCLFYGDYENPIFKPWTREFGGGPPCLWCWDGHLYKNHWFESNVEFLKTTLTVPNVKRVLKAAVARLAGEPEHDSAASALDGLAARTEILASR